MSLIMIPWNVTDQVGMVLNSLLDALSREGLFPETPLDIIQHLGVSGVIFIKNVF